MRLLVDEQLPQHLLLDEKQQQQVNMKMIYHSNCI
jgi:hypothetical protein